MSARARVDTFLRRARDACRAGPSEELIRSIQEEHGHSREGVLAVFEGPVRVELDASDRELEALVASMSSGGDHPKAAHVILSSTVFSSPLRAVACALARSALVTVTPSSRGGAFARWVVAFAEEAVALSPRLALASLPRPSEVFAYGGSETLRALEKEAMLSPGVVVRGHGPGFGVALVRADELRDDTANRLAMDVALFDQEGCLSPRVVAFVGDLRGAQSFARSLRDALDAVESRCPRGELAPSTLEEIERFASTGAYTGEVHRGSTSVVSVDESMRLAPVGRSVHIVAFPDLDRALASLGEHARFITTLGVEGAPLSEASLERLDLRHVRIAPLGRMQMPPLDGPVDRRRRG